MSAGASCCSKHTNGTAEYGDEVSPVQKVIQLLDELKGKVRQAAQTNPGGIASTGGFKHHSHVISFHGFFNELASECVSRSGVFCRTHGRVFF